MPSDPLVLGFDTSAAHCAAALLAGDRIVASRAEEMGRGQAERLFPMLEEVLAEAGIGWADLSSLGVGIGPGNFTGIRISVAAARGLALSLGIPARGVDSFAATAFGHDAPVLPTVAAPRSQLYLRRPGCPPVLAPAETAALHGLPVLAPPSPAVLAEHIARIASAGGGITPPAPLYVRPADAAPSGTPVPTLLPDGPGR